MQIAALDIKRLTFRDFNKELEVGRAFFAFRGNPAIPSSGHVFVKDVDPIRGCHTANYSRPIASRTGGRWWRMPHELHLSGERLDCDLRKVDRRKYSLPLRGSRLYVML